MYVVGAAAAMELPSAYTPELKALTSTGLTEAHLQCMSAVLSAGELSDWPVGFELQEHVSVSL